MKKIADVVFIVATLALTALVVQNNFLAGPRIAEAREGFFPDSSVATEFKAQSRQFRVLLILSPACRFCDESVPLYRALLDLAVDSRATFDISAVSREPKDELLGYLRRKGLADLAVPSASAPERFPGTPTLLVVDRNARVLASWVGRLSDRQEKALKTGLANGRF